MKTNNTDMNGDAESAEATQRLCSVQTAHPADGVFSEDKSQCARDAAGKFEIYSERHDEVAAVQLLCERHRDEFAERIGEVRKVE